MSVADLTAKSKPAWRDCAVCHALRELPDDKAAILVDLLSNTQVRYTELSQELAKDPLWRLDLNHQVLSRHVRAVGEVHRGMSPMR